MVKKCFFFQLGKLEFTWHPITDVLHVEFFVQDSCDSSSYSQVSSTPFLPP